MIQRLRIFLIILGSCLVLYGAVMLFYFGNLVYELLNKPEQVELVRYILQNIKTGGPMAYAKTPQGQEMFFEVSETGKAFGYLLVSMMALSVVSNVMRAMVWGGVEIIKVSLAPWVAKKRNNVPPENPKGS